MEFCHWTRSTVGLLLLQNLVFGIEKVRGLICTLCPGSSSQKLAWILVIQHWRFCFCTEYYFHDGFQFSCSSVSFAGRCTGCPSQSMFALSSFMLLSSPSVRPSEFVIALTDSLCNLERICSSSFPCFWAGIDLAQPWISNFETVWGFCYCTRSSVLRCLTLC